MLAIGLSYGKTIMLRAVQILVIAFVIPFLEDDTSGEIHKYPPLRGVTCGVRVGKVGG